jgi:hypothetical protein
MINRDKTKKVLDVTLKLVISVLIALEIAIPPNPYKEELILMLVIAIVLKHDIVEKILNVYDRIITYLFKT